MKCSQHSSVKIIYFRIPWGYQSISFIMKAGLSNIKSCCVIFEQWFGTKPVVFIAEPVLF